MKQSNVLTSTNFRDILKGGVSNEDKILQFETPPLASIMLHTALNTELNSPIDYTCYEDVFNDPGDDENMSYDRLGYNSNMLKYDSCSRPEFKGICTKAADIITYFRDVISIKKLKGQELSRFELALNEFINLTDKNQAKVSHLKIAVKLPLFYQSAMSMDNKCRKLRSFTEQDSVTGKLNCKIRPDGVFKKFTRKENAEVCYLHFVTDNKHLLEYKTNKTDILIQIFDTKQFSKLNFDAEVFGYYRTNPITGFTHFVCGEINLIS